jgi:putative nucleotidyltransferase with HDIG domain
MLKLIGVLKRDITEMIIESVPTGIVIINPTGKIQFVNEAVGRILGSMETVNLNILEFDTVVEIGLHKLIRDAFEGKDSFLHEVEYTSYTSREKLILNFQLKAFNYIDDSGLYQAMLLVDDITEIATLVKKVENQYLSMFKSFVKFIDAKDAYTSQHSSNVSMYAELILNEIQITDRDKNDILIAAALHDIGKIGIPDNILMKPDKLSNDEYVKMKEHSSIGADLLGGIEDYQLISKIIRHHHEKWDGSGYPNNLVGNEIPFGSQIIAIADAYDAIVSERVYRKARSQREAIEILKEESGKQFNGVLIDVFIKKIAYENK